MSTGKVISLNARMKGHDVSVPIRFVACQHVTQNCLLSLADYRKLLQTQEVRSVTGQTEGVSARGDDEGSFVLDAQRTQADTCREVSTQNSSVSDARDTRDENDEKENVDVLPLDSLIDIDNPNDTKVSELGDEQRADETLSGAFEFAKLSKGGYFLKSGILFHRTKILDNFVERLVVPKGRRRALLELAHDKLGCHLRVRRTKDRIGLSFMWPTMIKIIVVAVRCVRKELRLHIAIEFRLRAVWFLWNLSSVISMLTLLDLYLIIRSSIITVLYFLIIPQDFLMLWRCAI